MDILRETLNAIMPEQVVSVRMDEIRKRGRPRKDCLMRLKGMYTELAYSGQRPEGNVEDCTVRPAAQRTAVHDAAADDDKIRNYKKQSYWALLT